MTGHPKKKITKARRGMRRAHNALKPIKLVPCPKCNEPKMPHRVCENCGSYKGEQVIELKSKQKDKK